MKVERFKTNTPIDKLLDGGIEYGVITNVYGPAGSGKTNICLSAVLQSTKKTLYIDSEGSFSLDRFRQLGGNNEKLSRIVFIDVHTWNEQYENTLKLERIIEKNDVDLIVVDSLVALYRLVLDTSDQNTVSRVNRQLATIYSVLSKIAREKNIPVLVTNQVYGFGDEIEVTSKTVAKYWSKCLVELKKLNKNSHRRATVKKHRSIEEGKSIDFEISENEMKEIGRFF